MPFLGNPVYVFGKLNQSTNTETAMLSMVMSCIDSIEMILGDRRNITSHLLPLRELTWW